MKMYHKYPKTLHVPWSPGISLRDRVQQNMDFFEGKYVVITEKLDGENTTMYNDHIHARSIDSRHHESRDWVKAFHGKIKHELPDGWRICGENMFATHSIGYDNLKSYFYGFSIWGPDNRCMCFDDTYTFFKLLGISSPKFLYGGYMMIQYRNGWKINLTLRTKKDMLYG